MQIHKPSRRSRRKRRTATAILDATEQLLLKCGYEQMTMQQVADAADVAIGSLYSYFDNKARLAAAVVERALADDEASMDRGHVAGTPLDRLARLTDELFEIYRRHPLLFRLSLDPAPARSPALRPDVADRIRRRTDAELQRLAQLLREGVEVGELQPLDPEQTATFLWASFGGLIVLHLRGDLDDAQFDAVFRLGQQHLARALLAGPAQETSATSPRPDQRSTRSSPASPL
jgi:TetR/AcrR family transcriptional regulator